MTPTINGSRLTVRSFGTFQTPSSTSPHLEDKVMFLSTHFTTQPASVPPVTCCKYTQQRVRACKSQCIRVSKISLWMAVCRLSSISGMLWRHSVCWSALSSYFWVRRPQQCHAPHTYPTEEPHHTKSYWMSRKTCLVAALAVCNSFCCRFIYVKTSTPS